jgi:hypothetical protein
MMVLASGNRSSAARQIERVTAMPLTEMMATATEIVKTVIAFGTTAIAFGITWIETICETAIETTAITSRVMC